MSKRLAGMGFNDYRRSDSALMRLLARGPTSITEIGVGLGVSRQAARKALDGVIERGYGTESRDSDDARQVVITLTSAGVRYAQAIRAAISALNRDLERRVSPKSLSAADEVLRASITDETARSRADLLVRRPGELD